ncbi:MAG: glutathione S-transferase family protein [Alphaproteobacteria bacterium]|nr:glutathione S-transferase family protein [Alphaproteobacteria bacterium]
MVLLIHHPVSPYCRKIRIIMSEKKVLFGLKEETPWNLSSDVYKLNPAGELPIFINDGHIISGHYPICEYLEEMVNDNPLLPSAPKDRAEIRRLISWFDDKFYREVYKNIVTEKIYKRFSQGLAPDSRILKNGLNNLMFHLEYIDWLSEHRNYIGGTEFSLADIAAAAHLSIIDYLGDVPWESFKNAKIWYSKIKSRPSFKEILKDTIKGILPAKNYTNLDF